MRLSDLSETRGGEPLCEERWVRSKSHYNPAQPRRQHERGPDTSDRRQSKLSPTQLEELQKATHFDRKELQAWYKGTSSPRPHPLTKPIPPPPFATSTNTHTRLPKRLPLRNPHQSRIPKDLSPILPFGDPTSFADYVFRVFDADGNDAIDFKESSARSASPAEGRWRTN